MSTNYSIYTRCWNLPVRVTLLSSCFQNLSKRKNLRVRSRDHTLESHTNEILLCNALHIRRKYSSFFMMIISCWIWKSFIKNNKILRYKSNKSLIYQSIKDSDSGLESVIQKYHPVFAMKSTFAMTHHGAIAQGVYSPLRFKEGLLFS